MVFDICSLTILRHFFQRKKCEVSWNFMDYGFLLKCFVVGIIATSGVGPIFILTFNKGAVHGFLRGFATALGAAVADAFFFFLALMGILTTIGDSRRFMLVLDLVGGVVLLFIGYRMLLCRISVLG